MDRNKHSSETQHKIQDGNILDFIPSLKEIYFFSLYYSWYWDVTTLPRLNSLRRMIMFGPIVTGGRRPLMVNIQTVMEIINKFTQTKLSNAGYFSWNINYQGKNGKTLYKLDI